MSLRGLMGIVVVAYASHAALAEEPRVVRGTVNVPCRVYVQGDDGRFHFVRATGAGTAIIYDVKRSESSLEQHTTLTARDFAAELPPGRYTFSAERGKEYVPARQTITVPPSGETPVVRLTLERWIDMPARGWHSGDTHVHRKLEELPNLVEAEDLHVALPLTYWVRAAYESPAANPIGEHPQPRAIVVRSGDGAGERRLERVIWPVNTEYELFTVRGQSHTQGAVFVLNHKSPLRPPAPPVAPVAQAAREQGALLDLDKHSWNWSLMIVPIMNVDLFELANNHVWRTGFMFRNWTSESLPRDWEIEADAANVYTEAGWVDWGFKTYYALLNCGFRMRPTGGTASGVHPVPLGFGRVYVECPEGFTYDNWIAGLDAGRSFVTTGPMLRVTFDGQPAGTVFAKSGLHSVRVAGVAESLNPLTRIEIIVNGEVAQSVAPQNARRDTRAGEKSGVITTFDERVPVEHSAWIAVRCYEDAPGAPASPGTGASPRFCYAHTAPAHFEIDGPVRPRRREIAYFIERMEQEIARNRDVLAADEVAEYEQALAIYRRIAERARP